MEAEFFMRRAIELSRRGFPAPNPHVGCVIEFGGEIVGEGWHDFAGGPHAEVVALKHAGELARGATAYVSLEPCGHYGRTPPCTEALKAAGVAKVIFAVADPNPNASGGGCTLESEGIAVESGLLEQEALKANYRWHRAQVLGRPFVTVKAAISMDGKVATSCGESKWITGEAARLSGHLLRAEHAAILVGSQTVIADNPRLTARIEGVFNQPLRVILDGRARLTGSEQVFSEPGEVLWIVGGGEGHENQTALPEGSGPDEILALLWDRGITSVLIEGGPNTSARFFISDCVDEVNLFMAPILIGEGVHWFQAESGQPLSGPRRWQLAASEKVGEDVHLMFLRRREV